MRPVPQSKTIRRKLARAARGELQSYQYHLDHDRWVREQPERFYDLVSAIKVLGAAAYLERMDWFQIEGALREGYGPVGGS